MWEELQTHIGKVAMMQHWKQSQRKSETKDTPMIIDLNLGIWSHLPTKFSVMLLRIRQRCISTFKRWGNGGCKHTSYVYYVEKRMIPYSHTSTVYSRSILLQASDCLSWIMVTLNWKNNWDFTENFHHWVALGCFFWHFRCERNRKFRLERQPEIVAGEAIRIVSIFFRMHYDIDVIRILGGLWVREINNRSPLLSATNLSGYKEAEKLN